MIKSFKDLKYFVKSDLYRYGSRLDFWFFIRNLFFNPGFKYTFFMRVCNYSSGKLILKLIIFPISRLLLRHYMFKFGIQISYKTQIGRGFYIGHFGDIVISNCAIIGDNCNITNGVVIGKGGIGDKSGSPKIGNCVYIGSGSKVFGKIKIGSFSQIGANSVVHKSVKDYSLILGNPQNFVMFLEGNRMKNILP